jgi:hypothetical protein
MTALWGFDTKTGGPPDDDDELFIIALIAILSFMLIAVVGEN